MFDLSQTRSHTSGERPLLLRVFTMVALLLVTLASTVQVCHVHPGDSLLAGKAGAAVDSKVDGSGTPFRPAAPGERPSVPEDHCPLCVAMHSAMPAGHHPELSRLMVVAQVRPVADEAERLFRWRFELLSRPPPPFSAPSRLH